MKSWTLQLTLAICVLISSAVHIPLSQLKRSDYEKRTGGSNFAVINAGNNTNALGLTYVNSTVLNADSQDPWTQELCMT